MFEVSDKVVLLQPVKAVECFQPVPQVGRVYCVREVVNQNEKEGPALKLVGIIGVREEGEEVALIADKFRRLAAGLSIVARRPVKRRKKGGQR